MNKLVLASCVVISFALAFMLVIIYWLIYPYNPTTFKDETIKVDKKVVQSGSFIILTTDFCKNTTEIPVISRSFVDGIVYQIPSYVAIDNTIGCRTRHTQIYVPKGLPLGKYRIYTNYRWQVNPIRVVEKAILSESFEVVE